MHVPFRHRLNERTFIELFVYADLRAELLEWLSRPERETYTTRMLMGVLAMSCEATRPQLELALRALEGCEAAGARTLETDFRARLGLGPCAGSR